MAMEYAQAAPSPITEVVDEVPKNGGALCGIQDGYGIFDPVGFSRRGSAVLIDDVPLSIHKVAIQKIKRSTGVALFACAAGKKATGKSRGLMKTGSLLEGYVHGVF